MYWDNIIELSFKDYPWELPPHYIKSTIETCIYCNESMSLCQPEEMIVAFSHTPFGRPTIIGPPLGHSKCDREQNLIITNTENN